MVYLELQGLGISGGLTSRLDLCFYSHRIRLKRIRYESNALN